MKKVDYIDDWDVWKNSFYFSIPITIRFSETDMFGNMNNVTPFIYFEEARIEFMKEAGLGLGSGSESGVPVVGDLQCDYHRQLYFDDTLRVYVKAHTIGTTSTDLHYMVINGNGEVCLTARGRLVFIDGATSNPVPLRSDMKRNMRALSHV